MSAAEPRRPLRSIQSASPLHLHCNTITSNFPLVKEKDYTSGNSLQKAKRPGELLKEGTCMEPVKRAKHEPSLLAVDELLGRPSQAAQAPMPVQQGQRTDFAAAFNTVLRPPMPPAAPTQAPSHGSAAAHESGLGPSTGAGNTGGLTTFQDIAFQGMHVGANSNPEGMDAAKLRLLSTNFSSEAAAAAAAAAAGGGAPGASFSAAAGTATGAMPPFGQQQQQLQQLELNHRRSNLDKDWSQLNIKERWARALLSWRFPDSPMDADAILTLSTGRPGANRALTQRLDSWRNAFSSAYLAVRHRQSSGLYVIYPEIPRSSSSTSFGPLSASTTADSSCSTIILFTPGGARSNAQPQAMVSQSTSLMRNRMVAGGLHFSMPLARPKANTQGRQLYDEDADVDLDALDHHPPGFNQIKARSHLSQQQQQQQQQQQYEHSKSSNWGPSGPAVVAKDNTPASMLLFSGDTEVHALADYLLEVQGYRGLQQGGLSEGNMDLPVLLAPVHFEGASAHRPLVKASQHPFQVDLTTYTACITLNCCPIQQPLQEQHQPHQQGLQGQGVQGQGMSEPLLPLRLPSLIIAMAVQAVARDLQRQQQQQQQQQQRRHEMRMSALVCKL
ncbi:hypothetical protein DUNSADRAFT_12838 [Dunaliella salina]|uniref:Uncharacterized protein n=1 Tax=Dunaliella salina TaxID=3046 RepID=A0ABQ7H9P6_DUNSA|nr:hypothetical protein DUNSADRAFT_12838 [Dunaliella salina]|eukprot:KAF5843576.1 hypothetical protein DUNSADRAFT_12838 [Dunaliella salina]